MSSANGDGAETQREYWMREFDNIQHDGLIGFDEFQLHLARFGPRVPVFQLLLAASNPLMLTRTGWRCRSMCILLLYD